MDQVERRIAALAKSRARLLLHASELELLREQVGKAGAGVEPGRDARSCDPGPVGFVFAEEARLRSGSGIAYWPTRPISKSMLRVVKPTDQG